MANSVVRFEKFMLKTFTQMLQRSYSVASQTVPDQVVVLHQVDSLCMGYIGCFYYWYERQGTWSCLSWLLLPHLRLAAYFSTFLVLSSADFFLQIVNFYSSETKLDKVYTVDVIRGNDLSYDRCKKVHKRPYSSFPAKGWKHNFRNCHISCLWNLKNSKHPGENFKGK